MDYKDYTKLSPYDISESILHFDSDTTFNSNWFQYISAMRGPDVEGHAILIMKKLFQGFLRGNCPRAIGNTNFRATIKRLKEDENFLYTFIQEIYELKINFDDHYLEHVYSALESIINLLDGEVGKIASYLCNIVCILKSSSRHELSITKRLKENISSIYYLLYDKS